MDIIMDGKLDLDGEVDDAEVPCNTGAQLPF